MSIHRRPVCLSVHRSVLRPIGLSVNRSAVQPLVRASAADGNSSAGEYIPPWRQILRLLVGALPRL